MLLVIRAGVVFFVLAAAVARAEAQFTDSGATLINLNRSAVAWGDYDNDGDLDIAITGWTGSARVARVYRNDGNATFTDIAASLTPVDSGAVAWVDIDADADLDLVVAGMGVSGPIARVYRNASGALTDIGSAGLLGAAYGSIAAGDADNDGDLDLLVTGWRAGGSYLASVYRNDGTGSFVDAGAGLTPVFESAAVWGDYDNDGDLDIAISGDTGLTTSIARIYRNDRSAGFTAIVTGFLGVKRGGLAWGDYDNDGDLDLLSTGRQPSLPNDLLITMVYRNDAGSFLGSGPAGVEYSSVAWGDSDNDGDLDMAITGSTANNWVAKVYRNDAGTFVDSAAAITGANLSAVAWGDYDNDGDLDVLVSGNSPGGVPLTKLYRNGVVAQNSVPAAPSGLSASAGASSVTLNWTASTDGQTPANGLTYNIRVGTTPGGSNVVPPMSAIGSGYRHVAAMGNVQNGLSALLSGLPPGTYYWSVQAVDAAFAGSPFAGEQSFVVGGGGSVPGAAVLVSPLGTASSSTPTYVWNAVNGATYYYLWVNGPSGTPVIQQWYTSAQASCASTCSVAPNVSLGSGSHTWWIQTWNPVGYGPWSTGRTFTPPSGPPGAATLVSPTGTASSSTPTYIWNAVNTATYYYLWVNGPSGTPVIRQWYTSAQASCTTTCAIAPSVSLGSGSHTWWIQTWSPAGYGPWSTSRTFTPPSGPPGAATLVSPTGTAGSSTPTYVWNAVNSATYYYLWVTGPSGTPVIRQWYTSAQASCASTCSVAPSVSLASGSHTWWIQTWSPAGYGPWSAGLTFIRP